MSPDRGVRRLPLLLEVVLLDAIFVRGDGSALHAHAVLFNGLGSFQGDLVVGFVALFEAKIIVLGPDVHVGGKEFLFDHGPHDMRHLIAIHLNDYVPCADLLRHHQSLLSMIVPSSMIFIDTALRLLSLHGQRATGKNDLLLPCGQTVQDFDIHSFGFVPDHQWLAVGD